MDERAEAERCLAEIEANHPKYDAPLWTSPMLPGETARIVRSGTLLPILRARAWISTVHNRVPSSAYVAMSDYDYTIVFHMRDARERGDVVSVADLDTIVSGAINADNARFSKLIGDVRDIASDGSCDRYAQNLDGSPNARHTDIEDATTLTGVDLVGLTAIREGLLSVKQLSTIFPNFMLNENFWLMFLLIACGASGGQRVHEWCRGYTLLN